MGVEPLERDRQVRGWCASAKKRILFMAWAGRDTKFAVQNLIEQTVYTAVHRAPPRFFSIFNFMIIMFINIIIYLLLLYCLT